MKPKNRRELQEFLLTLFLYHYFHRRTWTDEEGRYTLDDAAHEVLEGEYFAWWSELTEAYATLNGGMRDDVPGELIDAIQAIGCSGTSGTSEQLREHIFEHSTYPSGFPNYPIALQVPRNPMEHLELTGAVTKEHIRALFSRMPDAWQA